MLDAFQTAPRGAVRHLVQTPPELGVRTVKQLCGEVLAHLFKQRSNVRNLVHALNDLERGKVAHLCLSWLAKLKYDEL